MKYLFRNPYIIYILAFFSFVFFDAHWMEVVSALVITILAMIYWKLDETQ